MNISICRADYRNTEHAAALVSLLDHYARDPMGGGQPLSPSIRENLVHELAQREWAVSLLAFDDKRAVGLLNAFEGFSTFACRPLINIHDIVVHRDFRGRGIAHELLQAIEREATILDCCKLTLEVLSANHVAKSLYRDVGFAPYQLSTDTGLAEFWQKNLSANTT